MISRLIGWALVLMAAAALGWELLDWAITGRHHTVTAGGVWFAIHRASLNLAQAVIQRHVAAWLWDPVIVAVLALPAWAVFGVPGAFFLWRGRARRRRRGIFRTDS